MIQKTTKIICDNCGQSIYDYGDIPVSKCLRHLKESNLAEVVYYLNGKVYEFCDEKCYEEWRKNNGYI